MNNFPCLSNVNVELTSRCNKACFMCGRRKIEKDFPKIASNWGDMDLALVKKISNQLPPNIVVQLHNNGDPLLYPYLGQVLRTCFLGQITSFDTNGKLLVEKAKDIIGHLDTLTISVIEDDPEADEQFESIKKFLALKGKKSPMVILRLNGNVKNVERYNELGLLMATRIIHAKMGSFNYRRQPTVPEFGICDDFLGHMSINRFGKVSICVRFDPQGLGVIGDANKEFLADIWSGARRMKWLHFHRTGQRQRVPLCNQCHFWGMPTSSDLEVRFPFESIDEEKVLKNIGGSKQ